MLKLCLKEGQKVFLSVSSEDETLTAKEIFGENGIQIEITQLTTNKVFIDIKDPKSLVVASEKTRNFSKKNFSVISRLKEFKTLSFWKNELIFMGAISAALLALMTIGSTKFWGLGITLFVLVSATLYYAVSFFKENQSFEKIYFYICMMPFLLFYFALIYKSLGIIPPGSAETQSLDWLDAIYFSVVTWTTLGYGDFRPGTDVAKYFVIAEVLLGYIYMGVFIGKLLLLGSRSSSR